MHLQTALDLVATYANPDDFDDFRKTLPMEWIERALEVTGTATVRTRRLPAENVVWLCIGMGMYRDRPITDIVEHLDLVLPDKQGRPLAPSAIPKARQRVGDDALHWLFGRTGRAWGLKSADQHRWRSLSLFGVDGSTKEVPDSADNRLYFGGPTGPRGSSGYPLVRMVALMALRSHILVGAEFGPYSDGELHYARLLLANMPNDSLTALDRAFLDAKTLIPLARDGKNRHWLTRAKKNTVMRVVAKLGKGDELVELNVSPAARRADPSLPARWIARAIRYRRPGHKDQVLLTSLLDAEAFPAAEIVEIYHERWELELGYDEIKTELLQREETLRSQAPAAISQELYGILLAYNLIRYRMEHVAEVVGVPPTRISFVMAMREVRDEWGWLTVTKAGAIPTRLQALDRRLARFILPPRRSNRVAPRAVKIKMSRYKRKRPTTSPTEKVLK
jgi:hypothetical protein